MPPSDASDGDQSLETSEALRIPRLQVNVVGASGGGDQQVGDPTAMRSAGVDVV
jgi:hypothetical protein